ncbi:hypothetical protein H1R20_g1056, partial [Candolleomyces eurysporus]
MLGEGGRPPPSNLAIGLNLMVDGIALEEVPRYDLGRNSVLGLCREHSTGTKKIIDSFDDLETLRKGLETGKWHYSKHGTMLALAPVTGNKHYYPTPILISGSCKTEKGSQIAKLIRRFIRIYNDHPMGRARHGEILQFSTDGESSFCSAQFENCLTRPLSQGLSVLCNIPGLNLQTGPDDLVGNCDPKHVIKCFAQMLWSFTLNVQLGDTIITYQDIWYTLSSSGMSEDRINALLNPQDKQNIPIALDLLKALKTAHILEQSKAKPGDFQRVKLVKFLAEMFSYFIAPFTDARMGLVEQVGQLSTYAHLMFALYQRHKQAFMKGALYGDSMSIVKLVMILIARYQTVDNSIQLYITLIGTD